MAIFETNLDYTDLIQLTNGTLQLASFVQIRNALIKRFQDIYGNDIDVSPASADGQYINSIALLINNIFQTIKQSYDSLDPASATGQYLDTLCSFNNISRINRSQSVAQLYIYNSGPTNVTVDKLLFMDKNNTLWFWDNGGEQITFTSGKYRIITDVICDEFGAISAPGSSGFYKKIGDLWVEVAGPEEQTWNDDSLYTDFDINGTIYQCVNQNGLRVWQYKDAEVGNEEESDESLRSRRYQMLGNSSVTILEGLKGNLLDVQGIRDVFIFNNPITNDNAISLTNPTFAPYADETSLWGHSIYIALRYEEGVEIDPGIIGRIIYNKLTPGISTSPIDSNTTNGTQGQYEIVRTEQYSDKLYWKICSSVAPAFQISFYINNKLYDFPLSGGSVIEADHIATSDCEKRIVENLQKYFDNVHIDDFVTISNMLTVLQQSDMQKQGMNTFFSRDGFINTAGTYKYPMNLAYLKYANNKIFFRYDLTNNIGTMIGLPNSFPISLNFNTITLDIGDTINLNVTTSPNTNIQPLFISNDDTIASIDKNGEITAEGAGTTTITVIIGDQTATCEVTCA